MIKNLSKYIKNILLFSFFCIVIVFTNKVEATSYQSDFLDLKDSFNFDTNEFLLNLEYMKLEDLPIDKPAKITGIARRKTNKIYYYHYIITYFNGEDKEIGATDGYNAIYDMVKTEGGSDFDSVIDSKNIKEPYKISDIAYYKIYIEPASKEIANNYIDDNIKLNPNGIDSITDSDTVKMKLTLSERASSEKIDSETGAVTKSGDFGYTITQYDISMYVGENNELSVVENITIRFVEESRSIFRYLPITKNIEGSNINNKIKIKDITTNEKSKVYTDGDYKVIEFENKDTSSTGVKNYEISYTCNLGKDIGKDYDELYYDLIGTQWDTVIDKYSFSIQMPKEFDQKKLRFIVGKNQTINSEAVKFFVNDNTIIGKYSGVLPPKEGFKINLILPDGYFVGANPNFSSTVIFALILPIIFALVSLYLWFKYGKDEPVINTVEFELSEEYKNAAVGYLYEEEKKSFDFLEVILSLENKKHLKIEGRDQNIGIEKFKFIKLKEYNGNNEVERILFNGMFNNRKEITLEDLKYNFDPILNEIEFEISNPKNKDSKDNKERIYEKGALSKMIIIGVMIVISFLVITFEPVSMYYGINSLIVVLTFPIIEFVMLYFALSRKTLYLIKDLIIGIRVAIALVEFVYLFPALNKEPIYLTTYLIGIFCILIMTQAITHMPKRTAFGNKALGKFKGYKHFIKTVKKSD